MFAYCVGGTVVTAIGCSPIFPGFESRPALFDKSKMPNSETLKIEEV